MPTAGTLQIVEYPHPALRYKAKPLRRVDAGLRAIVREMFELMYEARGVGLAAVQVDLPFRLFVVNLTSDPEQADEERVFVNPVLSKAKGMEEAEEGCLSLPKLYGQVRRPERVHVTAYDLSGQEISTEVDELLGRVIQHETDHLDGVLFIDRLTSTGKAAARDAIEEFEARFRTRRELGELPDDATIAARLAEWEAQYC